MIKIISKNDLEFKLGELKLNEILILPTTSTIKDVFEVMSSKKVGSLLIGDEAIEGIITERDLLLKFERYYDQQIICDTPAGEIMTKDPYYLTHEETFMSALNLMAAHDFRHLPVVDEEGHYKMLSVRDILGKLYDLFKEALEGYELVKNWSKLMPSLQEDNILNDDGNEEGISEVIFQTPLKRIYTTNVNWLSTENTVFDYVQKCITSRNSSAFVMEYETSLVGIVTERDFLTKFLTGQVSLFDNIEKIMTKNPDVLSMNHMFGNALKNMMTFNYRNTPIVNDEGFPIGNISLLELLSYFSAK